MADKKRAKIDVVIPTYHPDARLDLLITRLNQQTVKPDHIIIIRTKGPHGVKTKLGKKIMAMSINVGTYKAYKNIKIIEIEKSQFDHGATRNLGAANSGAEFLLFMTQDAVPANKYLVETLLKGFEQEDTAVVYGRQVPYRNAGVIEGYVRKFNYPAESRRKTIADLSVMGIKTFCNSNTCSCYRRSVFDKLGGFVTPAVFNEDLFFGAKAVRSGYAVYYQAKARVMHSHRYTWLMQFRRNFDNGVSQCQYRELIGGVRPEGEGMKLLGGMVGYLAEKGRFLLIPFFVIECMFRYAGFFLGKHYERIPKRICRCFSANRGFWS